MFSFYQSSLITVIMITTSVLLLRNYTVMLFSLIVLTFSTSYSQKEALSHEYAVPIEQLLNEDGTLKMNPDVSGSLNSTKLFQTENGAPPFLTNSDFQWDTRFGKSGPNSVVAAIAMAPNGDIYIGGSFTFVDTVPCSYVARWDGVKWSPLGNGLNNSVRAIVVSPVTGEVFAGGLFTDAGGNTSADYIAKWSESDGWSSLGSGITSGSVFDLGVKDSNIYIGGSFTNAGGNADADYIGIWNVSGNWLSLGSGGVSGTVLAIGVNDTTIYLGGSFSNAGGDPNADKVARWSPSTGYRSLGVGVTNSIYQFAFDGDDVYIAGDFAHYNSDSSISRIAKWSEANGWSPLDSGLNSLVTSVAVYDGEVYAGGYFTNAGGRSGLNYLARWSSSQGWTNVGYPINDYVSSMAVLDNKLCIGGFFYNFIGTRKSDHLAQWDGTDWSPISALRSYGLNGQVYAAVLKGKELYIGGSFTDAGGDTSIDYIARWSNINGWQKVVSGFSGTVLAMAFNGNDLYVGGTWSHVNGDSSLARIAKWDGSNWVSLGGGLSNGEVTSINAQGDGIIVTGTILNAGGNPNADGIAKWSPSGGWSAFGTGLPGYAMTIAFLGNDMYVGGTFTNVGGNPDADYFVKWNDSTGWSAVTPTLNSYVQSILATDTGLYLGGAFTNAGGDVNADNVAFWSPSSGWSAMGTGLSSYVTDLTSYDTIVYAIGGFSGGKVARYTEAEGWMSIGAGIVNTASAIAADANNLYVGGNYVAAGGYTAANISRWYRPVNWYSLSVEATHGTIIKSQDYWEYEDGDTLTLTAIPSSGYHFTGWGGDISDTTNPVSITMNSNMSVTANFAADAFMINVSATHGTVTKNPDQEYYSAGDTLTLTAIPDTGYRFVHWSGDISDSTNPVTFIATNEMSIMANFALDTFHVNVSASHGTVTKNPEQAFYTYGDTVTLTALPDTGYHFVHWSGDISDSTNPVTFIVTGEMSITANFALDTFQVNVNASNGTVMKNPDHTFYTYGDTVTLTALPDTGYHFADWSGDISDTTNPVTFIVTGEMSITANFALDTFHVNVSATHGTVTKSPDRAYYMYGDTVTLTALADTGYHFSHWSGDISDTTNPVTIIVSSDMVVTANFSVHTYALTLLSIHGSIIKTPDMALYPYGTQVTLRAIPEEGFVFTGWSGDVSGGAVSNPLTVTVTGNDTIAASFVIWDDVVWQLDFEDGGTGGFGFEGGASGNNSTGRSNSGNNSLLVAGGGASLAKTTSTSPAMVSPQVTNPGILSFWISALSWGDIVICWNDEPLDTIYSEDTSWVQYAIPVNKQGTGVIKFKYLSTLTAYYIDDIFLFDNLTLASYTLSVSAVHGAVVRTPDLSSYSEGSIVALLPVPDSGYTFSGWSGNVASGHEMDSILFVVMDSNLTVTANFDTNGVVGVIEDETPKEFFLSQNYPNPFNPSTVIRYSLPASSMVTLKVFNMLGIEVATLVHEKQDAGYKELTVNGIGLPSGMYFYRINVESVGEGGRVTMYSEVKRMVLLK